MKISEVMDEEAAAAVAAAAASDLSGVGSLGVLGQVGAVLRRGARGDLVVKLQKMLAARGYPLTADGAFGPATEAAVKAVQQKLGLTADGIWGPNTEAAFMKAGAAQQASPAEKQAVAQAVAPKTVDSVAIQKDAPELKTTPVPGAEVSYADKFKEWLKNPWYWVGLAAVGAGIWYLWKSRSSMGTTQVAAVETLALEDGLSGAPKPKRKRRKAKKKAAPRKKKAEKAADEEE